MFPRVLLVGERQSLEADWWGLGALQARGDAGLVCANPMQADFLRSSEMHLRSLVHQVPHAKRAFDQLYRAFLDLLDHSPTSLQWRGAVYEGPEEFAKLALETSGFRAAQSGTLPREVLHFDTSRALT
jgi:hypothetical protein